jgi:hypothetical protein
VARAAEIAGLAAATITLLTFFFRAWANLRRGRRVEAYRHRLSESADLELERLRAEIDEEARKDS